MAIAGIFHVLVIVKQKKKSLLHVLDRDGE